MQCCCSCCSIRHTCNSKQADWIRYYALLLWLHQTTVLKYIFLLCQFCVSVEFLGEEIKRTGRRPSFGMYQHSIFPSTQFLDPDQETDEFKWMFSVSRKFVPSTLCDIYLCRSKMDGVDIPCHLTWLQLSPSDNKSALFLIFHPNLWHEIAYRFSTNCALHNKPTKTLNEAAFPIYSCINSHNQTHNFHASEIHSNMALCLHYKDASLSWCLPLDCPNRLHSPQQQPQLPPPPRRRWVGLQMWRSNQTQDTHRPNSPCPPPMSCGFAIAIAFHHFRQLKTKVIIRFKWIPCRLRWNIKEKPISENPLSQGVTGGSRDPLS